MGPPKEVLGLDHHRATAATSSPSHQKPVRIFVKMSRVVDGKAPGQSAAARKGNGNIPSYAPNQTLYVTNIPSSKIQKSDLRISLYMLFSTYGPVLDVVALKTMEMRGQAHIVYRDVQTATQAMRALQGFELLERSQLQN